MAFRPVTALDGDRDRRRAAVTNILDQHSRIVLSPAFAQCWRYRFGLGAGNMLSWENVALAILVAAFGGMILDRLPKPKRHKDFSFELPDSYVTFQIKTIIEDDFKVTWIDGWETGRSFSLYGTVIPRDEDAGPDAPAFGQRTGLKIGGTSDWFQSSKIGAVRTFEKGGCECFITLPFQIARNALEDVRRDPDQLVTLGYKRIAHKDGKMTFPIYSFELSKPL